LRFRGDLHFSSLPLPWMREGFPTSGEPAELSPALTCSPAPEAGHLSHSRLLWIYCLAPERRNRLLMPSVSMRPKRRVVDSRTRKPLLFWLFLGQAANWELCRQNALYGMGDHDAGRAQRHRHAVGLQLTAPPVWKSSLRSRSRQSGCSAPPPTGSARRFCSLRETPAARRRLRSSVSGASAAQPFGSTSRSRLAPRRRFGVHQWPNCSASVQVTTAPGAARKAPSRATILPSKRTSLRGG
jgi:hypothetical protein